MRKLLVLLCIPVVSVMAASTYTFGLLPDDGNIGGLPGSTIGWGYSLQNQSSSLWLVTTGLATGTFTNGTPNLLFDFPDLAPGASVTVPFNASTSTGLLELTWGASAPAGFVNSGTFDVSAEWFNGNPLNGGSMVSVAPGASEPYSATVTPEPATIELTGLILILFGAVLWRRKEGLEK